MKKLLITAAAVLLATSAFASDLPNKKKAPAAPAPVAAATTPAAATSDDSLIASYGQDLGTNFGAKVDDIYQLTYKHNLGAGVFVGGMAQSTNDTSNALKQNLEAQAGYALPSMYGVVVSGKAGLGERFTTTDFGYYALYGNADYKLSDKLTVNAVQYRYRNSFDTSNNYASNQIGTGATYMLTNTWGVNGKIFRNYDTSFNSTGDGFQTGLVANF